MSGQTYQTTIHIPSAQELAQQVAANARNQGTASASAFVGEASTPAQARLQTLQLVVQSLATVARPVQGTTTVPEPATAQVDVMLRGTRVPLQLELDPAAPGREPTARVRVSFADAYGIACADERRMFEELVAELARHGLRPQAPTSAARAAELPGASSGRGASA